MNDLSPEARAILDAGRDGDASTAKDRERIRASLMHAITAGAGAAGSASLAANAGGAKASGLIGGSWKARLAALAIGSVGLVTVVGMRASSVSGAGETNPGATPSAGGGDRGAATGIAIDRDKTAIAQTSSEPAAVVPARNAAADTPAAAPAASAAPRKRPAASAENPAVAPEPPPVAVATSTSPPTSAPTSPPPVGTSAPVAVDAETLAAETRRLQEAHAALKGGDANRALALLDERGAVGPQLREERAAARVFALCDLGRADDARVAAARFLADSPRSPLADRVRGSCAKR